MASSLQALRLCRVLLCSWACASHLPVPLHGAELTDLHSTDPAFLCCGPPADFAGDNQLRLRIAVQSKTFKFIQQDVLSSWPLRCFTDHTLATKGRGAMDHWSLNGHIASQPLPRLRRLECTESAAPWPRHHTLHAGEGLTAPHKLAVSGRTQQQYHLDRDDAVLQAYDRPAKGNDQLLNASGTQVVMQVTDHTSKLPTFRKSLADTFSWTPRHAYSCCPSRSCSCAKIFSFSLVTHACRVAIL